MTLVVASEEAPALQPDAPLPASGFSAAVLQFDAEAEAERICGAIREQVLRQLRRRNIRGRKMRDGHGCPA